MRTSSKLLVACALVLAGCLPLGARGNAITVRLDITGGALTQPLTVTDIRLLELSHVYAGQFLGSMIEAADPEWQKFTVVFAVEARTPSPALAPTGVLRPYVVHYARDLATDEGFVYLPGRGEFGYRGNIGLIIREDNDGRWHRAAPAWAELLNGYLPRG